MKFLTLSFFLFVSFGYNSFSQEIPKESDTKIRRYVPLHIVLEKGIKLTRKDSLEFHFQNGDTLVLITPALERHFPQGIKVKIEPQDSLFIKKYKTAIYGSTKAKEQNQQSIKIWKDGIRLYFDASVPKKHQRELFKFAKNLASQVDSLSIKKVSERDDANYLVFYRNKAEDFDLDPRIVNPQSGYYINWKNNSYFTRASLKINTFSYEEEGQILTDLKKRFFETLGYFHSSAGNSCGSLLSVCGEEKSLSEEDLEILKYHYSYQNCVGISLTEFECQHEIRRKRFAEHPNVRMFVSHPKD